LAVLAYVLGDAFRDARRHSKAAAVPPLRPRRGGGRDPDMPWWQIGVFVVLGLIGLPLGADLLVDNASIIARNSGWATR
jgi:cation:H+ antiporter